jgi:hypothetical protein
MAHVIVGDQILDFRLKMLLRGLEAECRGMRLTAKGASCFAIIKKEFRLRGSKQSVLEQYKQLLAQMELATQNGSMKGVA